MKNGLRSTGQQGFTLLELLAVLLVIAIGMTVLLVGLNRGLDSRQGRGAAAELALAIRTARSDAILSNQPVALNFDLTHHTWQRTANVPRPLPANVRVQVTAVASGDGKSLITFYPDGSSTGGNIVMQSGDRRWRIDVAWLTGLVTLQEATPR